VYRTPSGWWAVSRLDDVRRMYTETSVFSNRPNGNDTMRPLVDFDDPDVARRLRPVFDTMVLDAQELMAAAVIVGSDPPSATPGCGAAVNKAFTRPRIAALHAFIDEEVGRCLQNIDAADAFDVNDDLATSIPLSVMTRLFGLDRTDDEKFGSGPSRFASQLDAKIDFGAATWLERHYR